MSQPNHIHIERQATSGVWVPDNDTFKAFYAEEADSMLKRYATPITSIRFACKSCHAEVYEEWDGSTPHTFPCHTCQQPYTADWTGEA